MTLAMVFPGQGSQSVAMQAQLAEQYSIVKETYAEASEVLGFDLWALVQAGPAERLAETTVTQPAMLTAGVAAFRAWREADGAMPDWMAGHSLGEYTALVNSGSLSFLAAVQLVAIRAHLMQEAVASGEGAMAAILGLEDQAVIDVCEQAAQGRVVEAVNFNSPGQVVIAGHRDAVERAAESAKTAGARRALLLSVSVPSHCALMKPASEKFGETLAATELTVTSVPVISNVDVQVYESVAAIRDGLQRQLYRPVRWTETITRLAGEGATAIVECGPGKVLMGLTKRINRDLNSACLDTPEQLKSALAFK